MVPIYTVSLFIIYILATAFLLLYTITSGLLHTDMCVILYFRPESVSSEFWLNWIGEQEVYVKLDTSLLIEILCLYCALMLLKGIMEILSEIFFIFGKKKGQQGDKIVLKIYKFRRVFCKQLSFCLYRYHLFLSIS